jgi:Leucine-rich repeat (LRR) protein
LHLSPTYEKAQIYLTYLEFCLKCSSPSSSLHSSSSLSQPISPPFSEKRQEKAHSSLKPSRERYTKFLFSLLEESQIHDNPALKEILENQVEELMSQEGEELTEKEKINYKWTKNLLGENKKVRQFALEKLQQIHSPSSPLPTVIPQPSTSASSSSISSTKEIHALSPPSVTPLSMTSLYNAIIQIHFPEGNENLIEQAHILDKIYEIESTLSIEEKVPYIFQKLFSLAVSLSPLEFEENIKASKAFTLSNYSSYLLNVNRLLLWQKLPGGTEYLNQPQIKALPLKKKGELLTRWIEEQGKNITTLNLDMSGLTSLPPELWQLTKLEMLCLEKNQLTTIPSEIGQLTQLQWLDLRSNQLTAIPAEIGQLTQLQWLYLLSNQLAVIPAEIGQLTQLQWLYLFNNQLTTLPVEIGQLSQLKTLDLRSNQLTAVPAEIGQLSQLKTLDLRSNLLTAIPAEIGQLNQLQWLYLQQNQLNTLPAAIEQLSHCVILKLSSVMVSDPGSAVLVTHPLVTFSDPP